MLLFWYYFFLMLNGITGSIVWFQSLIMEVLSHYWSICFFWFVFAFFLVFKLHILFHSSWMCYSVFIFFSSAFQFGKFLLKLIYSSWFILYYVYFLICWWAHQKTLFIFITVLQLFSFLACPLILIVSCSLFTMPISNFHIYYLH